MESNAPESSNSGPSPADALIGAGVVLDGIAVTLLWGGRVALLLLGLALIVLGVLRAQAE